MKYNDIEIKQQLQITYLGFILYESIGKECMYDSKSYECHK